MKNDLEIKRHNKNSIPQHTFEDIIEKTIPKMLEDPNTTNIASKNLGVGEINNEDLRLYQGKNLFALVGTWDIDKEKVSETNRIMPKQPLDSIYGIITVCSLISPEEHPSQFNKEDTSEQIYKKSIDYAKSVIDNSITSIEIEDREGNKWTADQNSLDRIAFEPKEYKVHKNCWPGLNLNRNEGIAIINGAFDSYCAFISFPKPDTYTVSIKAESPLFDSPQDDKFKMDVRYTITVI